MKKILLPLVVTIAIFSCTNSQNPSSSELAHEETKLKGDVSGASAKEVTFVHTVFFWMKEDLSAEEAKFFEEGMDELGRIPSILSYKWGKPAGTPRDVVDNSYTYAWIGEFATPEDQDAYQIDPLHKKFVEEAKDLWTKIQIYDTILE
jgi:hypothetical protein